ncbi:MAG: GntR family transcriptional regulator [Lachnospiraceae bacterium]|nr:GntR family transcriptional regulator [Lachnospiraceae bacterium]
MNLNKSTLSEQIYQILRSDILTQKIPLGEKLTLKHLQERFEVSSTPIREALTRLSQDGLVDYYSNIGVNVISLSEDDLKELYQFMGDLDRLAILYTAGHPEHEAICKELQDAVSVTEKLQNCQDMPEELTSLWIKNSDDFHLIFYKYCNNRKLKTAAETLRSQLTIFSNIYETKQEPQKEIHRMHVKIFEAYKAGAYAEAGDLMKEHLNASLEFALKSFPDMNDLNQRDR